MAASATALLFAIDWDGLPTDVRESVRELWPVLERNGARAEMCRLTGLKDEELKRRLERIREAFVASALEHFDDLDPQGRERVLVEAERLAVPSHWEPF
jgi:hypothetical protein